MNPAVLAAACCLSVAAPSFAQTRPLPPSVFTIKVRLKDDKGGPVQDATVQLVGTHPNSIVYRRVPGQEPRALQPKDFAGDFARLVDLPAGEFVLIVEAPLYAKAMSKPFRVPAHAETEVVVTLARGGAFEGRVVGLDDKPVPGAVVRTENGNAAKAGALGALLANLLVDTSTSARVTTGDDGAFRLDHLAHGKYRLVVDHPEFARAEVEAEVVSDAAKKLASIRLADGVLITGRVVRGTDAVPGAEVTFQFEDASAIEDPTKAMQVKTYKVVADDKGDFRLPARVPVGKGYVLMAAEPGPPLQQASQLTASRRRFDVPAGRREQAELLQLPRK